MQGTSRRCSSTRTAAWRSCGPAARSSAPWPRRSSRGASRTSSPAERWCTDGIPERRDPEGEFFGDERLKKLVEKNLGSPAEATLEAIFAEAIAFGNDRPWEDDATLVIVRRLAG
jgi:hypothetical protein